MCDTGKEIAKEIVKQGYSDISPAVKETAGTVATVVGFFNDVALYPLQKARINFQYKLKDFEREVGERYNNIPEGNRIDPPISILGPTIEGLKYTIDEKELRDMFVKLLSSSMDSNTVSKTHPAFVEIIKQLNKLDAEILRFLNILPIDRYPIANVNFRYKSGGGNIIGVMPKLYSADLCDLGEPFAISSTLENLNRLGIVSVDFTSWFENKKYENYKTSPFVLNKYKQLQCEENNIIINVTPASLAITDFGRQFLNICV